MSNCGCRYGRSRSKLSRPLSIAEYCSRSYNSASTSTVHDAIFSVHFSSATGDVCLPTSHNADDRQRLDADFNMASPTEDDIFPYATFAEMEQLQAARDGHQRGAPRSRTADNGVDATDETRRPRPRKADTATSRNDSQHRLEPQHIAANNDLNALYAQPHKFILKDAVTSTDNQTNA